MLRKFLYQTKAKSDKHLWRSLEIYRIEAFSDCVFALAITLLIISAEVPKSFNELYLSFNAVIPFLACFLIIFSIWRGQFYFFRLYGLEDKFTIRVNSILLFVVIVYVYPLKFLMSHLILFGKTNPQQQLSADEWQLLMIIYGVGFFIINIIFMILYQYAYGCRDILKMKAEELFDNRTYFFMYCVMAAIGFISVALAILLTPNLAGIAGYIYLLIGPALTIYYSRRAKLKIQKLIPAGSAEQG